MFGQGGASSISELKQQNAGLQRDQYPTFPSYVLLTSPLAKPAEPFQSGLISQMPFSYMTHNNRLEALANAVDFETVDIESVQPGAFRWTQGWKTEMGLNLKEQALLRSLLGSSFSDDPLQSLVKKLWSVSNNVCNQADRLYSQVQRAHTFEIPILEQQLNHQKAELAARVKLTESQIVLQQAKELAALKKEKEKMTLVFQQLQGSMLCPICTEVAILPKVLGKCGHIACQNCLKQLDDVAFATLTSSGARQHLLARRCPTCRESIIGSGFPVYPLKDIASTLIAADFIQVIDQFSIQKHIEFKAISFEKETPEQRHIAALQLGCYAQSELAIHSVSKVLEKVSPEQWIAGVYVMFEATVSRVFFETFATTLHGKAGGVEVLVNGAQRMLGVRLVDRSQPNKSPKKSPHLLVKVTTDGRFNVTIATPSSPEPSSTAANSRSAQPMAVATAATAAQSAAAPPVASSIMVNSASAPPIAVATAPAAAQSAAVSVASSTMGNSRSAQPAAIVTAAQVRAAVRNAVFGSANGGSAPAQPAANGTVAPARILPR